MPVRRKPAGRARQRRVGGPFIRDSTVTGKGGTAAYGVRNLATVTTPLHELLSSKFSASNGTANYGIYSESERLYIHNCSIGAVGSGAADYGIATGASYNATLEVTRSHFFTLTHSVYVPASATPTGRVAVSLLNRAVSAPAGSFACIGNFTAAYAPTTCP